MCKNKLHVCTYSTVRFTLTSMNLFVKVSRVCDTPDMMVWYIYQGMVELTTFFIDASVRLDVLFMFCVEVLCPISTCYK